MVVVVGLVVVVVFPIPPTPITLSHTHTPIDMARKASLLGVSFENAGAEVDCVNVAVHVPCGMLLCCRGLHSVGKFPDP